MKIEKKKMDEWILSYEVFLEEEEKSHNTISKYCKDIRMFLEYLNGAEIDKKKIMQFKEALLEKYMPNSVNSILAAINHFLGWLGQENNKVKLIKIHKDIFSNPEKEITKEEYLRLVKCAKEKGDIRLSLLLQTICGTGIRVSELRYITVDAVILGRVQVNCKGKNRTVFLSKQLCKALKKYCKDENIQSGGIFLTKTGKALDRSNIWKMMKGLCCQAKVDESKVFPHNLRHLFAKAYYQVNKDIAKLADLLGHTNINTTRIYMMESGTNHRRQLEKMNLFVGEFTGNTT
ncbi:MAG: tyrosine-type recombinase/integrase [Eubacteriales bacterium]